MTQTAPITFGPRYRGFLQRLNQIRQSGVSLGLERIRDALKRLGSPERSFPAVHIAGTNGKGSTASMTESILRAAGLRTGLFTSPHLHRFTERIRVGGQEVDGERLADLTDAIEKTGVPLTYFELSAVLAFMVMAEDKVDVGVLETGLGGRLDATNACRPIATAITSIDYDHTEFLGTELPEIAFEKAGIIKPGVPLYLGPMSQSAEFQISRTAQEAGALMMRYGADFSLPDKLADSVVLPGPHQRRNAAIAVTLARTVCQRLGRELSAADIRAGLSSVRWPGRMEQVSPQVMLDVAHNPEGALALATALPQKRDHARALVISIVRGKNAAAMLSELAPRFDLVVATKAATDRAIPPDQLAMILPAGLTLVAADPLKALALARERVGKNGSVVVAGSFYLVGPIRAALLGVAQDPVPVSDPLP